MNNYCKLCCLVESNAKFLQRLCWRGIRGNPKVWSNVLWLTGWKDRFGSALQLHNHPNFGTYQVGVCVFDRNGNRIANLLRCVTRAVPWWWYYPAPSEGWGRGGTPRRPNGRATLQGLVHRERGAKDRFAKGFRSRTVEEEMIEVL